jgi:hypothetical protein
MWNDSVVSQYEIPSYLPRRTTESNKNLSQDNQSLAQDSNPGRPNYEGMLFTQL